MKYNWLIESNKKYTKQELASILGMSISKLNKELKEYPELKSIIKKEISKGNTELYNRLKKIFPYYHIEREYKVENVRYDLYIKELNVAIEYDGIQHYQDNMFFGTLAFNQKLNDSRKSIIASKYGINLLRINYKNNPNDDLLREQILNISGGINAWENKKLIQKKKAKEYRKKLYQRAKEHRRNNKQSKPIS